MHELKTSPASLKFHYSDERLLTINNVNFIISFHLLYVKEWFGVRKHLPSCIFVLLNNC